MWRIAMLILIGLALTVPTHAKPNKSKQHGYTKESDGVLYDQEGLAFSPAERNLIRAHLLGQEERKTAKDMRDLPPGLQKKVARGKPLPPGWQKKIAPGKSLDYQVYRQGENLPDILLNRLPTAPDGTEILQVEDKIMLLNSATRTILDVFDLIPAN